MLDLHIYKGKYLIFIVMMNIFHVSLKLLHDNIEMSEMIKFN